jgi:hypothetical protein
MSFLKKLFGTEKKQQPEPAREQGLPWIDASENPWGINMLDLRSITQEMISTSQDPQMATNAVSYNGQDGTRFWGIQPGNQKIISSDLSLPIDKYLLPGVLFTPHIMEHKWAIFFDGEYLIFVRSWLKEVFVIAKTSQKDNRLIIENIMGEFNTDDSPGMTKSVLNFLLISHCMNEVVPAPLPKELASDTRKAGFWAFSNYGKMAYFGSFDDQFLPVAKGKLRSHSLLHIAVATSDLQEIEMQVKKGADVNALAGDGLATLHWSVVTAGIEPMQKLLELGADANIRSTEGATPIMNAVQSNKINHVNLLLQSGAEINARDDRGFTALHRAAHSGLTEMVKILLSNGADKTIVADDHTALFFAQAKEHKEIIELLTDE